jgi:hypothetical protein
MTLRRLVCRVMFLLGLPGQDCEHCNHPHDCSGYDMRKRLEDLRNHQRQPKPGVPIQPAVPLQVASSLSQQADCNLVRS